MRPGKELKKYIYRYIYLAADFLKTNLMKFAVIEMTRRQKVGFFKSDKLQIHSNEGKG